MSGTQDALEQRVRALEDEVRQLRAIAGALASLMDHAGAYDSRPGYCRQFAAGFRRGMADAQARMLRAFEDAR